MGKYILQKFGDGHIYKHDDGSYSVQTSHGNGSGATIKEALSELSKSSYPTLKEVKKSKKKTLKNTID